MKKLLFVLVICFAMIGNCIVSISAQDELSDRDVYERYSEIAKDISEGRILKTNKIILVKGSERLVIPKNEIKSFRGYDLGKSYAFLLWERYRVENPLDSYWFDNTTDRVFHVLSHEEGDNLVITYLTIDMLVVPKYSKTGGPNSYYLNPEAIEMKEKAVKKAKEVVKEASNLSDYDKLVYYQNFINNAVCYDASAPDTHQLLNVFDEDPNTNVCCDGYAAAFKYLCDITNFDSPKIRCQFSGGFNDEYGHVWNIVTMENGKNYVVDITGGLDFNIHDYNFLVGARSGSVEDGYIIRYNYDVNLKEHKYTYYDEIKAIVPESDLTLASENYK